MAFHVTILGSGTVIPAADRGATSLLVETKDGPYLFDCGPGVLEALEEIGFSYHLLRKIFITHFHPDHTLDIGRLLTAIHVDRTYPKGESLTFFGPLGLVDFIERWNSLYRSTIPTWDFLKLIEVGEGEVHVGTDITVSAAAVDHLDQAALAYRLDSGNSSLVFTGDTAYTESLVRLARSSDLLVSECSFPDDLRVEGHLTPSDVGRIASRAGVGEVVLVHLYPVFGGLDPVVDVKQYYDGPVIVARDGMAFDL